MSTEMLEQKVADLQKRLETLEAKIERAPKGSWRELMGWDTDDALFREAVRLGTEWRNRANTEGH